jgi:hypothetical protein
MELDRCDRKSFVKNNGFPYLFDPIESMETTYYKHEKGIVGIHFIDDYYGNKIMMEFIKESVYYSVRLKQYKGERSLALLVSRFHKLIEESINLNK